MNMGMHINDRLITRTFKRLFPQPSNGFDAIRQEISLRGVKNKTELRNRNWLEIYCTNITIL